MSDGTRSPLRGAGRRGIATFADQAVSSLTNFGIAFAALVSLGARAFGAFTVAYVAYNVIVAVNRGFVCQPLSIRYTTDDEGRAEAVRIAAGASGAIGAVVGALLVIAGAVVGGDTSGGLIAVGALLPLLLIQDTWRFGFFTASRPGLALVNDLVWAAGVVAGLAALFGSGTEAGAAALVWIWAAAGAVGAFVGAFQAGLLPRGDGLVAWMRSNGDLGGRLAVEVTLARGLRRAALYGVGLIAGLEAMGTLNGGRVVYGPMNVLYMGMFAFAIPEGMRIAGRSAASLGRAVRLLAVALAGVSLLLGAVLLLLPEFVTSALFDDRWDDLRPVVAVLAVVVAANGWMNAYRVGFRVMAAARESLAVEALTGPAVVVGSIVGAFVGGAVGAAVGFAVVDSAAAWVWQVRFRDRLAVWDGPSADRS